MKIVNTKITNATKAISLKYTTLYKWSTLLYKIIIKKNNNEVLQCINVF